MIKVVVYDDNASRRDGLEILLNFADNMECIGTYQDCTSIVYDLKNLKPDIVLMDIEMPEISGIEGVKILKNHYPKIKVIMQTVFEDDEKIFAALQNGADGYIIKNAGADRILQSIQEVYNGGVYMSPSVALRVIKYFKNNSSDAKKDYSLTAKEIEVLKELANGSSYKMVANKIGISYFTVNSHIKKIYEKLHVHSLGEAISIALKQNIV